MLSRIAADYTFERAKSFSNSEFGDFVRSQLTQEAKRGLIFSHFDLKVKSSVGQSQWAAVPWLAYFDPLITDSPMKGFYVVYLINAQDRSIFLSLNQGITQLKGDVGGAQGVAILKRRAIEMRERIQEHAKLFDSSPIDLGSTASRPVGYMAGHSFGRKYNFDDIDPDLFYRDLDLMLHAYDELVNRGGTTPLDSMIEEADSTSIEEVRRYVLSQRIERAPHIRKRVLEKREPVCECCNLTPTLHYGYQGPLINTPLDVHHVRPLMSLNEGESRRYKIPGDFLILCPNCHRMIHKQRNTADLGRLKETLHFSIKAKKPL